MSQWHPTVSITSKTPPHICGVGDYTINLATHCKQHGLNIALIVEAGCHPQAQPITIHPLVDNWSTAGLQTLLAQLRAAAVQTVILQYTCWSYSPKGFNFHLIPFWQQCAQQFQTLLLVHETYLRWSFKYRGTWLAHPLQKYLLRQLVQTSHQVFCGSTAYLQQLQRLSHDPSKLHYLPIPNNIPPQPFSPSQQQALRQALGLAPSQIVLALFGCRSSIYADWLVALDRDLRVTHPSIAWLLLGDAQKLNLTLQFPVIRPGFLDPVALSHHLQLTDLLLMPHEFGISAKRTSLMAALEHAIPVVGTQGWLTDAFFFQLPSLKLAPDRHYRPFAEQVLQALAQLSALKQAAATSRSYYQDHLSWPIVAQTLQPYLQTRP